MLLEFDVHRMRACMALWRSAIEIRPGLAGLPATDERAKLMAAAITTTSGWLDFLALCEGDAGAIASVTTEIRRFQEWARTGAAALALLGSVQVIRAN